MTWVIAHRGASWSETENTLPAFERAIALGADYVEFDVQMSCDGEPVVFHDAALDRLTPLSGPLGRRRADELRQVGIPTLREVLELTDGRIGRMVELKSAHLYRAHGFVERVVAPLARDDFVLSFQRRALLETRLARPELRLVQHVGLGVSIRTAASYAWGVGFWDPRVTPRGLARARSLGLATTVYTVNEPERMSELARLGVDGLFTDRVDVLRDVLDAAGTPSDELLSSRRRRPRRRSPRRRRPA
jgi:glycerophosphoryl diester phosphodiesterase